MSAKQNVVATVYSFVVWTVCLLLSVSTLQAQELEPRSYTNVPIGETFLVLGGVRSEGELTPVAGSVLQDAELTIDVAVAGLAHTFALGDDSAKVDFVLAGSCYEGSALFKGEFVEGSRCDFADPKLRVSWNFYGAPALTLDEYRSWTPGLVMGTSVQVSIPVGDYNPDNLINTGANRWMVRPGIGFSYNIQRWLFDMSTSVRFYEDNDDFFGGNRRAQDPLYSLQAHAIYSLRKGSWISLNANYFGGGQTSLNGIDNDDEQEGSRWGVTYSMPITMHQSVKLYASTGVITRAGSDFDNYGVAWQYRF
ncbi:MAG: transporter [Halioglobus sp.]